MPKVYVVTPNESLDNVPFNDSSILTIFLGGTIDNGDSENWQQSVIEKFRELEPQLDGDVYLLNPRRDNWNADLKVNGDELSDEFVIQVNWELDAIDNADIVLMNLLPDSKSPISLLEIGLSAKADKLVLICPKEFYRYGNLKIISDREGGNILGSLDEFFGAIYEGLTEEKEG